VGKSGSGKVGRYGGFMRASAKPRGNPFLSDVLARRAQGQSYRAIAAELGTNFSRVYRAAQAHSDNGAAPATITEHKSAPVHNGAGNSADLEDLRHRLEALEAHRLVAESFMASIQAQCRASAETVQPPVHNAVQTWQDPTDAKPERWNLWIPRGLRRVIKEQAKSAGIVPSKYVQSLLWTAMQAADGAP
jgi:hypothetical protein